MADVYLNDCNEHVLNTIIRITSYDMDGFDVKIIVDKANYGNYLYYDITCVNEAYDSIFMETFNLDDRGMGNVVADNPFIRQLLNYLALSDELLETFTGHITARCYRVSMLKFLQMLPD